MEPFLIVLLLDFEVPKGNVRLDFTIQAKTKQYTIWHFGLIIHMHTVVKEQLHIKASYIDQKKTSCIIPYTPWHKRIKILK